MMLASGFWDSQVLIVAVPILLTQLFQIWRAWMDSKATREAAETVIKVQAETSRRADVAGRTAGNQMQEVIKQNGHIVMLVNSASALLRTEIQQLRSQLEEHGIVPHAPPKDSPGATDPSTPTGSQ